MISGVPLYADRRDAAEVMEEVVKLTLGINQMCVVRRKKEVFCSCCALCHSALGLLRT